MGTNLRTRAQPSSKTRGIMDELEIRNKWEVLEGSDNIFKKKYNQQYIWNDEKSI